MRKSIGHGHIICSGATYQDPHSNGEFTWVSKTGAQTPASLKTAESLGSGTQMRAFGYMFDGDGLSIDPEAFDKLGRVGAAMVTDDGVIGLTGLPAILTYFGQFIDHDITLNTDSNPEALPEFSVANPDKLLKRNSRDAVTSTLSNGRIASLRLDSLYGDETQTAPLLRDGPKMKIGVTSANRKLDIPRMADLPELDPSHPLANSNPKLALIGDDRNDENLIIAQLHLAFLRFHNAIVDTLDAEMPDEAKFAEARRLTTLTYQHLVLHEYCGAICDAEILSDTLSGNRAEFYREFSGGAGVMPLEFSVAAFRFGHSMIRHEYRHNESFPRASLEELFMFTGSQGLGNIGLDRLIDIWVIDWRNFLSSSDPALAARGVDPQIAVGLDALNPGQTPSPNPVVRDAMRHLPARNLRRSYVLAVPTAQQVLGALGNPVSMAPLSEDDLRDWADGILETEGYLQETPLWLYILLEAELQEDAAGKKLGKLGSFIVAQTLVGLLAEDPASIFFSGPNADTPWSPSQEPIGGEVIDSLEKLLAFAGVL